MSYLLHRIVVQPLVRIADIAAGRISHWNATSNIALQECFKRIDALPIFEKDVFTFLLAGGAVAAHGLFLERDLFHIPRIGIDPMQLKTDNFRKFYTILLAFYVYIFCTSNPSLKDSFRQALFNVVGDRDLCKRIALRLDKEPTRDQTRETPIATMRPEWLWMEVANSLEIAQAENYALSSLFYLTVVPAYTIVAQDIVRKWHTQAR